MQTATYLGRTYFPGVNMVEFNEEDKLKIENDIEIDFKDALKASNNYHIVQGWSLFSLHLLLQFIQKN